MKTSKEKMLQTQRKCRKFDRLVNGVFYRIGHFTAVWHSTRPLRLRNGCFDIIMLIRANMQLAFYPAQ